MSNRDDADKTTAGTAAAAASDHARYADDTDKTTAGAAALSICESLLIALNDLKIFDDKETRAVLEDAAESHRIAIRESPYPEEHRAVAALIDRIIDGKNSVRKF